MSTWPPTVPHRISVTGAEYRSASNAARTTFDVGPDKARPRSTATRYEISGTIRMTNAEFAAFRTFFEQDIKQGTQIFDMVDPIAPDGGMYVRAQIMDGFSAASVSGGKWIVSLRLKVYR